MTEADVNEFKAQRNAMPGDRYGVKAVGQYILELYLDPMGQRPRSVIEVNQRLKDGSYEKATSIWFNTEDSNERSFKDPESASKDAFDNFSTVAEVEAHF